MNIEVLSAAAYHADPCPAPSLSASLAHVLLSQSPAHAWAQHPRNPLHLPPEESEAFDLGTAAHGYLLEGHTRFAIIEASDWRTKAAREARDAARAAGQTPILAHRWADVHAMADAARGHVEGCEPPIPFTTGRPELTLTWQEPNGVWCRIRPDWLHDGGGVIDDYKTTSASAHPSVWSRALFGSGYDLQAALYVRGVKAVLGVAADFRFIVQENYPPYALSVVALDPEALDFAMTKVTHAITLWGQGLETGVWPSYTTRTCYAEAPAYVQAAWLERKYYDGVQL